MYKLGGRRKLGKTATHRRAMLNNQLRSILNEGKVKTTTPKAKVLKANVESYLSSVSKLKKDKLEISLLDYVPDREMRKELASLLATSPSVKMVKVGFRAGDNAELSRVFIEGYDITSKTNRRTKKKSSKKDEKKNEDKSSTREEDFIDTSSEKEADRAKSITKTLKDKVIGKERARTRAGI